MAKYKVWTHFIVKYVDGKRIAIADTTKDNTTEKMLTELNQQAEEIERLQAERETLIYDDIQSLARKNVELEQKIIDLEGSNPYTSQLVKRLQAEKDKLFNRANSLVTERNLLKRLVHLAWDVIAEDTNSPQLDTETFLKGYEAWVEANKFAAGSDHAGVPVERYVLKPQGWNQEHTVQACIDNHWTKQPTLILDTKTGLYVDWDDQLREKDIAFKWDFDEAQVHCKHLNTEATHADSTAEAVE